MSDFPLRIGVKTAQVVEIFNKNQMETKSFFEKE